MFRGSFKLRAIEEKDGLYGLARLEAQMDLDRLGRIYAEFVISGEIKVSNEPFFHGKDADLEYILRRQRPNWVACPTASTDITKKVGDLDLRSKQKNVLDYSFSLLPGILKSVRFTPHDLPIDSPSRKKVLSGLRANLPGYFVDKIDLKGRYLSAQRDIR